MHDVLRALQSGKRFLIASHAAPDGDAVGSMAAMGHLLLALGKEIALYNVSGLPRGLSWVKLPGGIATDLPPLEDFDFIVALDCGDSRRGGPALQQAMTQRPTIVIDHHVNNPQWGAHNWVETDRSSTGEMVAELARDLGVQLDGPLGEAVYLCIVTDTGHFSFDNTSPRCMELTAQIMRLGLRPAPINELIQNQWSLPRFRLWGEVLGASRLYFDGQLGVIRITREQLERLGADAEDCDGLANFLLRIKGCRVVQSLREDEAGGLKLSLRSLSELNIQPVAAAFGGGGHRCAAGASIKGGLDEVEPRLIEALGQVLGA